jgi:uncharacterized protein DUF4331
MRAPAALLVLVAALVPAPDAIAHDHNDPDEINAIFPDIESSPADIYSLLAWPEAPETIALVLTWADVEYDRDVLYQVKFDAEPGPSPDDGFDLGDLDVFGLIERLADLVVDTERTIHVRFGKRGGQDDAEPLWAVEVTLEGFTVEHERFHFPVETQTELALGNGDSITAFVGRRDDPFFIDLPGFFDSIAYGHPPGPESTWGVEDKSQVKSLFAHDADGNVVTNEYGRPQFVYDSNNDGQAGRDAHALVLRIPRKLVADDAEPIVDIWSQTRRIGG